MNIDSIIEHTTKIVVELTRIDMMIETHSVDIIEEIRICKQTRECSRSLRLHTVDGVEFEQLVGNHE